MHKNKIYDCITFYDENILANLRFEILKDVVDYFIVCESMYDHKNKPKKINFSLLNKDFEKKVRHLIIEDPFPNNLGSWDIEKFQRETLMNGLQNANDDDYIMYSDSDEIPNPELLKNIKLNKKFGIFLQNFFVYNMNTINDFETPWEGTRVCKKKDLVSITHLRKKVKGSNLKNFLRRFLKPHSIQFFKDGGWHFNNFYSPEKISKKLKTFQHTEFSAENFSNIKVIENKIKKSIDLFERGHQYRIANSSEKPPEEILNNYQNIKKKLNEH